MRSSSIIALLDKMDPISLDKMDSISLMNRIDTKYVTTLEVLESFLEHTGDLYYAFCTSSGKINRYDTTYYDTREYEMYLAHHNKRLTRKKVRVRTYCDSGQTFLEIKRKNNHRRTKKKRIECNPDGVFEKEQAVFLKEKTGYDPEDLDRKVRTSFDRITLVNKAMTERLTIDMNIVFFNYVNGNEASLKQLVIIELKQDGIKPSDAKQILRDLCIFPYKISKYCIGSAITMPELKQNLFKAKILHIEKLLNSSIR